MKVLLLALNAKYIHSSLALRSIKSYCVDCTVSINLFETTINNYENEIIKEIYKAAPDILGISCYIWNMGFIKTLIPTLKKVLPHTTIILGGPEVSYDGEELLSTLDVDIIMEGEGEATWKEYLDYLTKENHHLSDIKGLIYKEGSLIKRTAPRTPLDLNELPFVYEDLNSTQHKIIYYEASRGCPFNCQYCLSSVQSGVRFVPIEKVKEHMQYFYNNKVRQVKFVDRTFNANKNFAMQIWQYLIDHDNAYTNFHFEIAADLIDDEIIELLKRARAGLFQFEIGVQSTNSEVLTAIKRKMSYQKVSEVTHKIKDLKNIHQHLDLIAGLPLETYHSFGKSFNKVMLLRPEQLQLGFLKVLKGSGLRRDASLYGLVYKAEAPYEILYNDAISYNEMLRLHGIEEMLERYYNSGRFQTILEYLFTCYESPFSFFEALSYFWEEKGYDKVQHNKLAYYLHLAEFTQTIATINYDLSKEFIRFDYLRHEHLKEIPAQLQTFAPSEYKAEDNNYLKDDVYIASFIPQFSHLSPRQRYRLLHIERFKYDVFGAYTHQIYHHTKVFLKPSKVLFDYSQDSPRCILLNEGV